ncbi:putative Ca2+/H+ antiporter (TMEM165/GDT1 family) [Anaerosolibacter carboniphilus]|uniref:GDT1 family protein n=1 Tax=Anaerosolibacter carboniphilus TaxID=1417629 RepID=A0A841KWR1_9FIRM|nr:TMEM165/GDT1 family protein [Anaerosolibacter carboniphilus]MBB6218064.1 putative Ca2+/H+ antiporter (TMEM165/GDT1 family) [Anaerosolibacter carboniphilus]
MWKIIVSAFWMVFIAELGDKTQLQTMLLATQSKSVLGVFIGAASALVLSALIGVFAGTYITKYIPPHYLQLSAGVAFIVIGMLTLWGKI